MHKNFKNLLIYNGINFKEIDRSINGTYPCNVILNALIMFKSILIYSIIKYYLNPIVILYNTLLRVKC